MAHFVNIPAPKNPGDHGISELSLKDPNGTCGIGVWGMPAGSSVKAEDNPRFVAGEYKSGNKEVRAFYCRGLKAGDNIAAFLPTGERYTSWLPIKFVRGDHFAKQRKAGTLPRSVHKANFILDPHGAEQRKPPVKEADWTKQIEANLAKIKGTFVGVAVLNAITKDITIAPYLKPDDNANSAVTFTPQQWPGNANGNRADEVLLHELVHVLESNFSGYVDHPTDGLNWDKTDFLTVTVANVYSSSIGRPLRKDHHGFVSKMPDGYRLLPAIYKTAQAANFTSAKSRLPGFYATMAAINAPWNPFKFA
jgi:hypothetical protein